MSAMACHIASLTTVFSTVDSGAEKKKTSKLRVIGRCEGNSPVTGEFSAQRASNAENVSIWWCHHVTSFSGTMLIVKQSEWKILNTKDVGPEI